MKAITPSTADDLIAQSRAAQLAGLLERIRGADFALMGPNDAARNWCVAADFHDLDLWVSRSTAHIVDRALRELGAVRLGQDALEPRLQHRQWWLPGPDRGAIVDVTVGDLRVGPMLLCDERSITTAAMSDGLMTGPRLTGHAGIADLLVRPLLRGRVPENRRLNQARNVWGELAEADRHRTADAFASVLGRRFTGEAVEVLEGSAPNASLPRRARLRLAVASLKPSALRSTWTARYEILGTGLGPFGLPSRGALVAFVGTDGSGKTTLAERLEVELDRLGYQVDCEYLGMARSNLPGLAVLRRLVRGPDEVALAPRTDCGAATNVSNPPRLARTLGAWCYAIDYAFRSLVRLRPAVRHRSVVLCDRWVTDLRRGPAPGSSASRVAECLAGRPHVMVLASAPADVIVGRKPERTLAEAAAEQADLALLIAEFDAFPGTVGLEADTSGAGVDPIGMLVAAVVAATHRHRADHP